MSNYPLGSENDPNAPWNSKTIAIDCPECNGDETIEEDDILIVCPVCNGDGEIELDEK